MDERLNDYNKFDKLVLCVKDNKTKEIIGHYAHFGWELVESVSNKKYGNIMDLTFVRPHNIKNKDQIQLLQAGLDVELNKLAKLENKKHSLSVGLGFTFIILGLLAIIFGIVNAFNVNNIGFKILSWSIVGIGCLSLGLCAFFIPKIIRHENIKFAKQMATRDWEIKTIFAKLDALKKEQ